MGYALARAAAAAARGDVPVGAVVVRDGVVVGVKSQRQWEIGYWGVKYLVALNQNHTIPMDHPTGSVVMTKETFSN